MGATTPSRAGAAPVQPGAPTGPARRRHLSKQARDNIAGYLFTLPWMINLVVLIGLEPI